jgi:hypothetical protein
MYKALANQFAGKAAFGEVRSSNAELSKLLGVSEYPTLLAICNGDVAASEKYGGKMKSEAIAAFVNRWALREVKPIGCILSYLACRIGHLVAIWQLLIGSFTHGCHALNPPRMLLHGQLYFGRRRADTWNRTMWLLLRGTPGNTSRMPCGALSVQWGQEAR